MASYQRGNYSKRAHGLFARSKFGLCCQLQVQRWLSYSIRTSRGTSSRGCSSGDCL